MPATRIWDGALTSVFATAGNWSDDTAPVAGDTAILPDGNTVAVAGAALYNEAFAVFTVRPGYSGTIGSRTAGVISDLTIVPVIANLAGSGVAYINLASVTTCNVTGAAAGTPLTGSYGLALSGSTITTLNIDLESGQSVGVAALAGQTCTATTINIDGRGMIVLGEGLTYTTLNIAGSGTIYLRSADATTNAVNVSGTPTVYIESGGIATLVALGGTIYNNTTGTIATTSIYPPAWVKLTDTVGARIMTTINVYGDGGFDDSSKYLATCAINDYGSGANIRLGTKKIITRTTLA